MNRRLDQLRAWMAKEALSAFLVSDGVNRRYLSGFSGSAGVLVVTADEAHIVVDFRYFEQATQQAEGWQLWKASTSIVEDLGPLLEKLRPARLGFEADAMTVADWQRYREKSPDEIEWVSTDGIVREMRAIKDHDEIAMIRRAQQITDEAARQLPRLIQPSKTEKQVAWEVETLLRDLGADRPAFEIIVASGPNSALPHSRPGERVIQADEIVLVDFGAALDGYHSDTTRTFFTGEPSDDYRRVYHIVLEALQKVEGEIGAGYGSKAGDSLARDFIGAHGHREHFGHSLGHGVGLDIHERPALSFRATDNERLQAGNVTTVEPGIYLPGWGGVRLEDIVLVTEDGVELLTTAPKDVDAWRKGQR